MVVVLADQLGHLADGVVVGLLAGDEAADEGDLSPDHEAGVVAQVVEILVVLVVGQADGVGAHFLDEGDVLLMVGAADGPALVEAVLMAGDAVQGHVLAVEPEAGVGVHMEGAVAVVHRDSVHRFLAAEDGSLSGVAVGVGHAVPQVGVLDRQGQDGVGPGGGAAAGDDVAGGVFQVHRDGAALGLHREQVQTGGARDNGGDKDGAGAALQQVEVGGSRLDEADLAVQPAEEGEVGRLGVNVGGGVGDVHPDHVAGLFHGGGQVKAEGGKTALMLAQQAAVAVDGRHMVGALELDVLALAVGGVGQVDLVSADAAPIVVAAVLAVFGIPGMRQGDGCKGFALFGKAGGGEQGSGAHKAYSFRVMPAGPSARRQGCVCSLALVYHPGGKGGRKILGKFRIIFVCAEKNCVGCS